MMIDFYTLCQCDKPVFVDKMPDPGSASASTDQTPSHVTCVCCGNTFQPTLLFGLGPQLRRQTRC